MNTPNRPEILRDYIIDAAHQRRLMKPWLNDQQFIKGGGKVAYAVDTDVIMLFTNPVEESIPQEHRSFGYATIFRNDDATLSIAFGQSLAEHIFTKLGPDGGPLMVMPSLEAEIGRVFAAVARDASNSENAARKEVAELRETIEELQPFEKQPDRLVEELKKRAPELAKILHGVLGPNARLNRFGRLFSDERIAGLDFLAERNEWYDAELRKLFPAIASIPDLYRLNQLTDDWLKALKETKNRKTYKNRVEDDAQALARLQWMNEKIDSKRFRIVFITGDEAISKAAARSGETGSGNFRDLYIRNPRAFMADSRVLFPWADDDRRTYDLTRGRGFKEKSAPTSACDRQTRDLTELFELFLGELPLDNRPLKLSPDMVTDFREKWEDFTSDVAARAIPLDLTAQDLGIDGDVVDNITKIMDKVEKVLDKRIDEAWTACFNGTAQSSGFHVLSSERRPRNAPPLYFDRFKQTTIFVRNLLSTTGKINLEEYQESLDMLGKEDAGIGYLFNLAFAILFASRGRWSLTAILADRALQKVKESDDKQLSGREAYYLKAITLRHTARKAADLGKIDDLIHSALACLEEDKKNHEDLKVLPIRFEIERTSAKLALSLFDIFCDPISNDNLPSLKEIQAAFQGYFEKLSDVKSQMDSWIYLNIERNLLTNIFMTALLRVFKNEESVDTAKMASLFKRFESNVDDNNSQKIGLSYLVNVVHSVSKICLGHGNREFIQKTRGLLSDDAISNASVMPYDKQRFEFLRGIVEKRSRFPEPR